MRLLIFDAKWSNHFDMTNDFISKHLNFRFRKPPKNRYISIFRFTYGINKRFLSICTDSMRNIMKFNSSLFILILTLRNEIVPNWWSLGQPNWWLAQRCIFLQHINAVYCFAPEIDSSIQKIWIRAQWKNRKQKRTKKRIAIVEY